MTRPVLTVYRIELRRLGRDSAFEELRLGDVPVLKKYTAAENARLRGEAKAAAGSQAITLAPGHTVLLAVARRGAAGPLYALLGAGISGEHCALDWIDWGEQRVERVPLNFRARAGSAWLPGGMACTLPSGTAGPGDSFLSWGDFDKAEWSAVKDTKFTP